MTSLLDIVLGGLLGDIGVSCTPINVLPIGGSQCSAQTVCCEDNSYVRHDLVNSTCAVVDVY